MPGWAAGRRGTLLFAASMGCFVAVIATTYALGASAAATHSDASNIERQARAKRVGSAERTSYRLSQRRGRSRGIVLGRSDGRRTGASRARDKAQATINAQRGLR